MEHELPSYQDSSGSISRRFVVINFKKKVKEKDSDPLLRDKLHLEIPAVIKKCNTAYLEAVKLYGKKNIWPVLPKFFHDTRDELKEQSNYMQHFLNSEKLQFGEENFCSEKDFKNLFNEHCKENNFPKIRFTSELYQLPFTDLAEKYNTDFKIEKRKKKYKGLLKHVNFVMGIGILEDEDEDE
jgi:phage/plasmid-associated DNA primase